MPPNIFFLYDIKNKVVLYYMSLPSCCVFFAITFPTFYTLQSSEDCVTLMSLERYGFLVEPSMHPLEFNQSLTMKSGVKTESDNAFSLIRGH